MILGSVALICYYLLHHMPITLDNELYYRQAVVTGQSTGFVIHGMSSLYVNVLHVLFLLFGNNPFAGIVLQLVLYFLLLTLIYFVCLRLCGAIPACAALTFVAILYIPTFWEEIFSLTPELLYLCMYFLGMWFITGIIKRLSNTSDGGFKQGFWMYLVGIYIGYLIYLDLFSVTLLFFLFGLFCMEKVTVQTALVTNVITFIGLLNGVFFVLLYLFLTKGIEPLTYLISLCGLYFESFKMMMPSIMPLQKGYSAVVMLFMLFGLVPGYSIWKKDCITTWIACFASLLAMQFFAINRLEYNIIVTVFVSIMGGIGLYCYVVSNEIASSYAFIPEETEIPNIEECQEAPTDSLPVQETEKAASPLPGQPLHNPLPVPKKHEKKSYDFPYETKDHQMEFDHDVDEQDDFDFA